MSNNDELNKARAEVSRLEHEANKRDFTQAHSIDLFNATVSVDRLNKVLGIARRTGNGGGEYSLILKNIDDRIDMVADMSSNLICENVAKIEALKARLDKLEADAARTIEIDLTARQNDLEGKAREASARATWGAPADDTVKQDARALGIDLANNEIVSFNLEKGTFTPYVSSTTPADDQPAPLRRDNSKEFGADLADKVIADQAATIEQLKADCDSYRLEIARRSGLITSSACIDAESVKTYPTLGGHTFDEIAEMGGTIALLTRERDEIRAALDEVKSERDEARAALNVSLRKLSHKNLRIALHLALQSEEGLYGPCGMDSDDYGDYLIDGRCDINRVVRNMSKTLSGFVREGR